MKKLTFIFASLLPIRSYYRHENNGLPSLLDWPVNSVAVDTCCFEMVS